MTTTTTRRHLLAGAAAVPLLPAVTQAGACPSFEPGPAVAAGETSPVRAKFEEWKRIMVAIENRPMPDHGDRELDRYLDVLLAVETELFEEPAQSDADIALKFAVLGASEFSLRTDESDLPGLMAEVRRILSSEGVSA